jgi:hypothetical protein
MHTTVALNKSCVNSFADEYHNVNVICIFIIFNSYCTEHSSTVMCYFKYFPLYVHGALQK